MISDYRRFLSPQLTPENKGTIIVGMCDGLLHLHAKDIVHQDLKPENIMVSGVGDEYYINILTDVNIIYRIDMVATLVLNYPYNVC